MITLSVRTPADVGALIKDRRRELGLDQSELAKRIGVSRLWVNQVEGGKPGASLGLVLRALAAVGVEPKVTIGEEQPNRLETQPVVHHDINEIVAKARRKFT
jgi:HTH-type transcriptional regulator / antitoxin HipB